MEHRPLPDSQVSSLAKLIDLGTEQQPTWTPRDLEAIWRHQLDSPLALDLAELEAGLAQRLESLAADGGQPLHTFRDLFANAAPPLDLLETVKDFARSRRAEPASFPPDVATMLYLVAIVVAGMRCGQRITELDDEELASQINWALGQQWTDPDTRAILEQGRTHAPRNHRTESSQARGSQTALEPGQPGSEGRASDAGVAHLANGPGGEPEPSSAIERSSRPGAGSEALPALSVSDARGLGQLGEYRLLEKLGEGGMGVVYQALHVELDRIVAVKVLRPERVGDESIVARFRREIKAAGRLDHPNIVRALDARKIDHQHLLVMEYVDGVNLHQLVAQLGPLPVAEACELARQAALALDCAHQNGLVHRDIKPSNLILARTGQLKLLDLGLARFASVPEAGGGTTLCGTVMGTPDYMAPEQAADSHEADIRSDIYSLGCVLYKLLAGRAPFEDSQHASAMRKITAQLHEAIPPLATIRNDLPSTLLAILARMLDKDPEKRFATPDEVVRALTPLCLQDSLQGLWARIEPEEGKKSRRVESPSRAARSRRRLMLTAAAVVIALLTGSLIYYGGTSRPGGESPAPDDATQFVPVRTPPPAVQEDQPGWIVLSWTRPRMGKPDLWLFRPDGKKRINLTNDPRSFHIHPHFSPDGRQVAYVRGSDLLGSNSLCICRVDGSGVREVVAPKESGERFASPVWVSNTRLYYCRDPRVDLASDMEVWEVDVSGGEPRRVFRFGEMVRKRGGLVTDVSPDGQRLAVITQSDPFWTTADAVITDLGGRLVQAIWEDHSDKLKDARALWSPDGRHIAWHRNFVGGSVEKATRFGVGIATRGPDGRFTPTMAPQTDTRITPLAWSPDSGQILCARLSESSSGNDPVVLFLMDLQFREVRVLFELEGTYWQPGQRDAGRLGDWVIVPADVKMPGENPAVRSTEP